MNDQPCADISMRSDWIIKWAELAGQSKQQVKQNHRTAFGLNTREASQLRAAGVIRGSGGVFFDEASPSQVLLSAARWRPGGHRQLTAPPRSIWQPNWHRSEKHAASPGRQTGTPWLSSARRNDMHTHTHAHVRAHTHTEV